MKKLYLLLLLICFSCLQQEKNIGNNGDIDFFYNKEILSLNNEKMKQNIMIYYDRFGNFSSIEISDKDDGFLLIMNFDDKILKSYQITAINSGYKNTTNLGNNYVSLMRTENIWNIANKYEQSITGSISIQTWDEKLQKWIDHFNGNTKAETQR